MKPSFYIEGKEATKNFEEGMKAMFKVSKAKVVKAEQKKKRERDARASVCKPKNADKD